MSRLFRLRNSELCPCSKAEGSLDTTGSYHELVQDQEGYEAAQAVLIEWFSKTYFECFSSLRVDRFSIGPAQHIQLGNSINHG